MSRLGIRKIISHCMSSDQSHIMVSNPKQQQRINKESLKTQSRSSVIAEVPSTQKVRAPMPSTQKVRYPLPELKPSVINSFVLGKQQQDLNYLTNLKRNFYVPQPKTNLTLNTSPESDKPELLRYLRGSCDNIPNGQDKSYSVNNTNKICPGCNAKLQGALENFKKQQEIPGPERLKGALDQPVKENRWTGPCCCKERVKQKEEKQEMKEKEQRQRSREKRKQQQSGKENSDRGKSRNSSKSPPFSIIVLQDCKNNCLIDQLTAALTDNCQQSEQPQFFKNPPPKNNNYCSCKNCNRSQANEYRNTNDRGCTCNCQACRTGFEDSLKLPMLIAQALEIFIKANSLTKSNILLTTKNSKHSLGAKHSSASLRSKDKEHKSNPGGKAAKGSKRSKAKNTGQSNGQSRTQFQSQSRSQRRSLSKDKSKSQSKNQSNHQLRNESESQSKNQSKDKLKDNLMTKSNDKFGKNFDKVKQQKNKQNVENKNSESKFFLPKSNSGACSDNCQASCARFSGGCRQGNLNSYACSPTAARSDCFKQLHRNVGAGDQGSRGNCTRSVYSSGGCSSCAGCSNCGHFVRLPPPRENMHPVAHFRHSVNRFPAPDYMIYRYGDFLRHSLVRTAAGVTLHGVERENKQQPKPQQQRQPIINPRQHSQFPCAGNCPMWR